MASSPTTSAAFHGTNPLHQLISFRWGLVLTTYLAAAAGFALDMPISSWPLMFLLLLLYGCSNLVLRWLPGASQWPQRIFALAILLDLALFSLMLALSGGAGNGLIALLLLPVAISAVLLPGRLALLTATLAVACYLALALLLPVHNSHGNMLQLEPVGSVSASQPMPAEHAGMDHSQMSHPLAVKEAATPANLPSFHSHLWQMAWAFTLSAFFIAAFVSAQARLVRQKSQQLAKFQQQQWQQEQMLAVATYAANAAHDLATPLQNLTLLTDELLTDQHAKQADATLLADLRQQVDRCQHIVQQLRHNAQQLRDKNSPEPLHQVSQRAIQLWLVSRPDISAVLDEQVDNSLCPVTDTLAWSAAIFNILDNAADASQSAGHNKLELQLRQQQGHFLLQIRDFGQGLSDAQLKALGQQPQQSDEGLGLGQFLASSSIERLGGRILRQNRPAGDGLLTRIDYPAGAL